MVCVKMSSQRNVCYWFLFVLFFILWKTCDFSSLKDRLRAGDVLNGRVFA